MLWGRRITPITWARRGGWAVWIFRIIAATPTPTSSSSWGNDSAVRLVIPIAGLLLSRLRSEPGIVAATLHRGSAVKLVVRGGLSWRLLLLRTSWSATRTQSGVHGGRTVARNEVQGLTVRTKVLNFSNGFGCCRHLETELGFFS